MSPPKPFPLKPGLEPLPDKMAGLPIDERGFPVPYFVQKLPNGEWEFRAMDPEKLVLCIEEKRCWICGNPLGKFQVFVVGPMCCINRTSAEPPSHRECALYAVKNCPFLINPNAERRESGVGKGAEELHEGAGVMIRRNPGVTALWTTTAGYKVFDGGNGGVLFNMGPPTDIEWWSQGRKATRDEVKKSIETGLPNLFALCDGELAAIEEIGRRVKWLGMSLPPKEGPKIILGRE